MTRRHHPSSKVVTAFTKIPQPLTDGRVRCICSRTLALTKAGRIPRHNMPNGDPCAHEAVYQPRPQPIALPDVHMPPTRGYTSTPTLADRADPDTPRLLAGSCCVDCDRWLPGERSLCGRCGVRRERERERHR
jgi:hypothetical protein